MNIERAVDALEAAERTGRGIAPFSSSWDLNAKDAWQVARARDARRRASGLRQSGYKLGWTSAAMRDALGISAPNYGSLWDYMAVQESVDLRRLIHPKAEPEFAFRADSLLEGPRMTEDDVLGSGVWAVAIEVVDPRWTSYSFTWADNTADGSSAARYSVGPWSTPLSNPADWCLAMSAGQTVVSGRGEAALGSPALAVVFLVQALYEAGEKLRPGMVVLTGGVTAPIDLFPGLKVRVESPALGACELICGSIDRSVGEDVTGRPGRLGR